MLGTVFFGYLSRHSFRAAMVHTAPYAIGAFALCGVLSMLLPEPKACEVLGLSRVLMYETLLAGPLGNERMPHGDHQSG